MKVVREVLSTGMGVSGGPTVVCPPRASTGFFPGGGGIPNARPGIIPGTFIGPTLIFSGVLNPGIPTTVPPTNPVVSTTGTQVQISPAFTETTTGTTTGTTTTTTGTTTTGTTTAGSGTGTVIG